MMRVLVVMDPVERINPEADTTLVLIEELVARGHLVEVCGAEWLELERGDGGRSRRLSVYHAGGRALAAPG
jgi:hypothetical protein